MAESNPQGCDGSAGDTVAVNQINTNPSVVQDMNMAAPGPINTMSAVQAQTPVDNSALVQVPGPASQTANLNQGFPQFSRLPKAIQNQIWQNSFEPRLIEWGISAPVPASLQMDRSSRQFAKKKYFFAHWAQDITNVPTYVHQQRDIIYWKQQDFRAPIPWWDIAGPPLWIRKIFFLAMDIVSTGTYKDAETRAGWNVHSLLWSEIEYRCPALKTLYVILEPVPSRNDPWDDLDPVVDWDDIKEDEEEMVVAVMETMEARRVNKEWLPEVEFMRKKAKLLQ